MIAEQRYQQILEILQRQRSATVQQLAQTLRISESTIRRDLITLDSQGRLVKVHGGAMLTEQQLSAHEPDMITKEALNIPQKQAIGRYAASLIQAEDFVYVDAGSTTLQLVEALAGDALLATYVTNGLAHAKLLTRKGCNVYVPAGNVRLGTEAIVGVAALNSLQHYNYTKAFIGANGVSIERGCTTPSVEERELKAAAIQSARKSWILVDESKFDTVYTATFCPLNRCPIITNRLPREQYRKYTVIEEADLL